MISHDALEVGAVIVGEEQRVSRQGAYGLSRPQEVAEHENRLRESDRAIPSGGGAARRRTAGRRSRERRPRSTGPRPPVPRPGPCSCRCRSARHSSRIRTRLRRPGETDQSLHDAVHPAGRIPDAMSKLRIGEERQDGRRLERAQADVEVPERERALQARRVEVCRHPAVVVPKRIAAREKAQRPDPQVVDRPSEVAVDHLLRDHPVVPRPGSMYRSSPSKLPGSIASSCSRMLVMSDVSELTAVVEDQPIRRIDGAELESFRAKPRARETPTRTAGHDEERGTRVEPMAVAD